MVREHLLEQEKQGEDFTEEMSQESLQRSSESLGSLSVVFLSALYFVTLVAACSYISYEDAIGGRVVLLWTLISLCFVR